MMDKTEWVWDREQRRIGRFCLGAPIETVLHLLEKLERYEDESWDTYQVLNFNASKIFVIEGNIYSVQCGEHFMVGDEDIIGKDFSQREKIFSTQFDVEQQYSGWKDYVSKDRKLKVIVNDKGQVRWVIYYAWEPGLRQLD